jgi:hypothetical protein
VWGTEKKTESVAGKNYVTALRKRRKKKDKESEKYKERTPL